MRFLDSIANAVLWFTDQDWTWWRFFVARPKQTEPFTRDLVVDLALIAAIEAFVLAVATCVIRGDVAALGVATSLSVAMALGLKVFVLWGAIVSVAAMCWNRRAARLSGTRLGAIPPKEPSPETDKLTFWLVVLSTVAFFQMACGGGSVPSDCGQGLGLFWALLLVLVLGLTPIMRWSVMVVAQYRPPWSAAYKAAYAGLILGIDFLFAAIRFFPEINIAPIGSMPAGQVGLLLMNERGRCPVRRGRTASHSRFMPGGDCAWRDDRRHVPCLCWACCSNAVGFHSHGCRPTLSVLAVALTGARS